MIDSESLRLLGWSEELINEVTRTADGLNGMVLGVGDVHDYSKSQVSFANNSAIFDTKSLYKHSANSMTLIHE